MPHRESVGGAAGHRRPDAAGRDLVTMDETRVPEARPRSARLAVLLAAAMFVLVVDTSLMNVSISAVVEDLDTTVSGVQSAIALEALVSAAFILISSKVGDLIGRKRAYVLGLLAYAIGAAAMVMAQSLTAIIVFWAIVGGLGASLLLPAMQSLIHGNFDGAARKKTYALVGAAAAPTMAYTFFCAAPWKLPWIRDCMDGSSKDAPSPPITAQKMMIAVRSWARVMARAPTA